MNISEKLMANILKLIGLLIGSGIVLLISYDVFHIAFMGFMATGLILLAGVLGIIDCMLDDIMELREALQNNDLEKLVDMRGKAYITLTFGSLMFLMVFAFVLAPLIAKFGLTSYITAYILLLIAIFAGVPLAHNIYIIKKASPEADKWCDETWKTCELERPNENMSKKMKTARAAS